MSKKRVIKRTPEQQLAYEHRLLKRKMERNSLTLNDLARRLPSATPVDNSALLRDIVDASTTTVTAAVTDSDQT